jgi:hypothetical protein
MNGTEIREFRQYLKQCTDAQVRGVYEKENAACRFDYAELAIAEAEHRGLCVEDDA